MSFSTSARAPREVLETKMKTRRQTIRILRLTKKRTITGLCLIVLAAIFVGITTISYDKSTRRKLYEIIYTSKLNIANRTFIDEDGVCVNAYPYAKIHDLREEEITKYEIEHIYRASDPDPLSTESFDHEAPPHVTLPPGSSVANWLCLNHKDRCNTNGINIVKGSAWDADGVDAFGEDVQEFHEGDNRRMWVPHENYLFLETKRTVITGDAAAFFGFHTYNFGHCLHDNFPMVAWLKSILPDHTIFILPDTGMYRKLLHFIDPEFTERVYFYQPNEIVTVEDGTLTVAKTNTLLLGEYGNTLFRPYRHWIFDNHPEHYTNPEDKYIVFHTRGGPHTEHGRALEIQHEQDVLALIRSNMAKYNRKEQLIIFSGQDDSGDILPLDVQFDVFRRASTIIGPHGSGLANIIWTYPFPKECNDRVQMLEFISGTDSEQVQTPVFNGYYWVMRGMPIDWNQIVYASNSTRMTTYLRLDVLQNAIDGMWGGLTSES